jgi:hypothetical protein
MGLEEDIRRFELELPVSFRSHSMQGALAWPYLLFQVSRIFCGTNCQQNPHYPQNQFLTLQIYHARAILLVY